VSVPCVDGAKAAVRLGKLSAILLLCVCSIPRAQARATLFVGEPYGYDAFFAGTGHAAVYLSGVCAESPVVLRLCNPGEDGVVLSRYLGIGGYDWIAIPLVPYLYAVEKREDVLLFADPKMVSFLRDRYRREHLESLVPDLPDGGTPDGDWYELLGASYLRTIYTFEIETSVEQDANLIHTLNSHPNHQRWNLVRANCADFARQVISLYFPHSVHRRIVGDLAVTTPKQLASGLSKYSRRHPELQSSSFVIPQVPGTIPRSARVRGVLEVAVTAKKYMVPIIILNPVVAGVMVAGCLENWQFNPGRNAPILDSNHEMAAVLTRADRRVLEDRFAELERMNSSASASIDQQNWKSLRDTAEPALDSFGGPVLQLHVDGVVTSVGVTRANILDAPASSEFAVGLVKARLREELKSGATKKTARADVESDLALLQELLALQPKGLASTARFANDRALASGTTH
jgi:hypothetical protein